MTNIKAADLPQIDLLVGGSPCQGFSISGKQRNFDDPRSKLFFEYARLLKECKPDHFLLENVKMKKEYQGVISDHVGVSPVLISSKLVSAQSRDRLYWSNIQTYQPKDKGLVFADILDTTGPYKYLPDCDTAYREVKKLVFILVGAGREARVKEHRTCKVSSLLYVVVLSIVYCVMMAELGE